MSLDPKSSYYDAGGIETIAIIKAKLTPEQFQGFLLANIIKYSCRLNHKGQRVRDAEKVRMYSALLAADISTDAKKAPTPTPEAAPRQRHLKIQIVGNTVTASGKVADEGTTSSNQRAPATVTPISTGVEHRGCDTDVDPGPEVA